jgi:serine/threonine-protein kinase
MGHTEVGERTWIDEAADHFEGAWRRGGDCPRIVDHLADQPPTRRDALLEELIRVERELRTAAGEAPDPDEYLRRFPDDRDAVAAAFGLAPPADPPPAPPASAAHSLLFGLLALQNRFVDRETLLTAFDAWVADKAQDLGRILLDRGALTPARYALLGELVQEHLDHHGQDPERSLVVLAVAPDVRDRLERVPDVELQASLLYLRLASTDEGGDRGEATATYDDPAAATDPDGRFQIVRLHDRGALGEVYVARDQQLHRIVALKRIQSAHAVDREKCARFVVEAEITGRLEHPGIVPVYGLGAYDDGRPFYGMRFIRGDNLKAAIEQFHREEERGRAPGARALALQKLLRRFLDVCNAIDYAHSRGVLHRDLKPGNIMLGRFGETLVVDWGLAKSLGRPDPAPAATLDERTLVPQSGSDLRGTEFGARLGTPAYMSPEQAAGRIDELGPASDVYSLGATLYCLLTGRAPFTDPDMAELLRKVERGEFVPPRKLKLWVDPALEAICLKAMATEPARRYRTPRALADDVEHWLAEEPVAAWREPIRRRLRRWGRRHRLLVTGLAATLLVAVAALAVGYLLVARQRDIAERNLAFARRVVDEMYTGVAAKLDDQVQMEDYQREILEKALGFYERFALPQSRDPRVRLEAARAGLRAGAIRLRLGDSPGAEQADRQAVAILAGLTSDHPAEPDFRDALARSHDQLSAVLRTEARWAESEAEIRRAAAIWDALTGERPGVVGYRSSSADAHLGLGYLHRFLPKDEDGPHYEAAGVEYRRAMDIASGLVREYPDVIAYQELLARILQQYGFHRSLHDRPGADTLLQRAEEIADRLARDHPEAAKYQYLHGQTLRYQGQNLIYMGRLARAGEVLDRSIALLERLRTDHPLDLDIALYLGTTYLLRQELLRARGEARAALEESGRAIGMFRSLASRFPRDHFRVRATLLQSFAVRAETLMRLGRHAEALAVFDEVLGLAGGLKIGEMFRAFHALTRARLGDPSDLIRWGDQVREILRLPGPPAQPVYSYYMLYYDAACLQAALARLTLEERERPAAERQRLARRDLERALDLLEESRSHTEPIDLAEIRTEPTLEPLRSHPRFRLLMMDWAFPDDPFRP